MVIKRGQVFNVALGEERGSVQAGTRPVLIIQNDVGNMYSPTVIGVPLTSRKNKRKLPTHKVLSNYNNLINKSTVLAEQIITFNKTQIINYICNITEQDLRDINKKIVTSLAL